MSLKKEVLLDEPHEETDPFLMHVEVAKTVMLKLLVVLVNSTIFAGITYLTTKSVFVTLLVGVVIMMLTFFMFVLLAELPKNHEISEK